MRGRHNEDENRYYKYLVCYKMWQLLDTSEQPLTLNEIVQMIPDILVDEKKMFTLIVDALHIGNNQVKSLDVHYRRGLVGFWKNQTEEYATDHVN